MSESNVRAFVEQATQALQGGQPGQALELAEQALSIDSRSADATLVRAIALSQLLRAEEATAAFEQAQALDGSAARISYNFAVHLQSLGKLDRAKEEALRALQQTPNHAGARQILSLIEQQETARAQAPVEGPTQPQQPGAPPVMSYARPGYDAPEHSLRWVENMGKTWTVIGWGIATVSLIFFLTYVAVFYVPMYSLLFSKGTPQQPGGFGDDVLRVLFIPIVISSLGWMVCDILDRRGNWFWLVPTILCCCCTWIPLLIYMAAGRTKVVRY